MWHTPRLHFLLPWLRLLMSPGPTVQMPKEVQRGASWIPLAGAMQWDPHLGELWLLFGCCDSSPASLTGSVELKAVWAPVPCSHSPPLSSACVGWPSLCHETDLQLASPYIFTLYSENNFSEVIFWPDSDVFPPFDQFLLVFFLKMSVILSTRGHPRRDHLQCLPAVAVCEVLSHVETLPPGGSGGYC